jgi:hypothetical protein
MHGPFSLGKALLLQLNLFNVFICKCQTTCIFLLIAIKVPSQKNASNCIPPALIFQEEQLHISTWFIFFDALCQRILIIYNSTPFIGLSVSNYISRLLCLLEFDTIQKHISIKKNQKHIYPKELSQIVLSPSSILAPPPPRPWCVIPGRRSLPPGWAGGGRAVAPRERHRWISAYLPNPRDVHPLQLSIHYLVLPMGARLSQIWCLHYFFNSSRDRGVHGRN